ncbi:Single-stranded-DNA-specific exonuclease RecJ [Hydrogenovibrio crunogenus]|uniref:Single-stranded-DNA-specific exonuclease RecJ n=1 Tax=Hydrogenovibrio crunogenus TaxID=39765 RepID=A0A4P7P005_9GAMM|nr:DHH family phosphoesterase [Hydrogenovibrio crunogenus]QBZ83276.1 Single-stranded-DNA-specific exonuclease RecJ [Hydrogenovibrio crunogenus]
MLKYPKKPLITERTPSDKIYQAALSLGLSELQAKLVANRLTEADFSHDNMLEELQKIVFPKLQYLQHPEQLKNAKQAAELIADAVESDGKIVLATDYDTDGVTSAWVATRALIDYFGVSPERIEHMIGERKEGYGITEEVVNRILAIDGTIDLVISADQGSSDEPRIKRLADAGIKVCVTDHHQMTTEGAPASAACTVNPQQTGCNYDKTVAGCFVIFLVMGQTRAELIRRQVIPESTPSLKDLTQNIALGTVADSVSLKSVNNRAIVQAGLAAINQFTHPAWQALQKMNDNQGQPFNAEYLGFQVATRINAASRVSDVTTAFKFLNAPNLEQATPLLAQLDQDNLDRRSQQEGMLKQARETAEALYHENKFTLSIRMTGNAGIQGIIASRIGEQYGVPTIAMTDLEDGYLAGSGRGIVSNIDLREAFQTMAERHAGLFKSMGGHKGAAGCMIPIEKFDIFSTLFEETIQEQLNHTVPTPTIETDGQLAGWQLTPSLIQELNLLEPYGREWPKPLFSGFFEIQDLRPVGQTKTHLSFKLRSDDHQIISAIFFNAKPNAEAPDGFSIGENVECAYQPSLNTFYGKTSLQLKVVAMNPL